MARHLRPGGIYILGFHLSKYDEAAPEPEPERWSGSRDGVSVDCKISSSAPDSESRVEHVRSELVIEDGGRPATLSTEWDFRTYDAAEVRSMLRGVPELSLETCYDFRYDLDEERELEDPWEDVILVLKRKG